MLSRGEPPLMFTRLVNHSRQLETRTMAANARVKRGAAWASIGGVVAIVVWFVTAGGLGPPELGPVDGEGLPPTDLERVQVGDEAPDFTLLAHSGDILTLSDYRRKKNVILVFYRGHW